MPKQDFSRLVKKELLTTDIYKFSVKAEEIVKLSKPGNFIEIRVTDQVEPFLRRPISIYNLNEEKGILEFIFQVKGRGTKMLSKKEIGDKIDIIGPLGSGTFKYDKFNNIAIIGGGIGVFPLYELAKCAKNDGKNVNTYLGFRSKDFVVLEKEFEEISSNLTLTTDDGSYKIKGFAINLLEEALENNPYNGEIYYTLAHLFKETGDIENYKLGLKEALNNHDTLKTGIKQLQAEYRSYQNL